MLQLDLCYIDRSREHVLRFFQEHSRSIEGPIIVRNTKLFGDMLEIRCIPYRGRSLSTTCSQVDEASEGIDVADGEPRDSAWLWLSLEFALL